MVTLLSTAGVQTPGLTLDPLREIRLLVTAVPLGPPRKGELKGKGKKNQREEVTRQTGLVVPCLLICRVPKDTSPTAKTSDKILMEAFEFSTTNPNP